MPCFLGIVKWNFAIGQQLYHLDFDDDCTPMDVALRMWLSDQTILERKHAEQILLKPRTFALVYGFGDQSLADELGVPLKEGKKIKQQHFDAFPQVAAFIKISGEDPFSKGYTTTLLGRKRWYNLPDLMKLPREEVNLQNSSIRNQGTNTPVQGSLADITKLATVMVADVILVGGWDAEIVNSIHDELLIEVRADQAEAVMEIAVHEMVKAGEFFLKDVPVVVDAYISDHWVKD